MRIAIGAIIQESNTFSPLQGTLDDFRTLYYLLGDDIFRLRDSSTELSGFLDVLDRTGHELLPTVAAMATSSGRLSRQTFDTLRHDLISPMEHAGTVDAVLLALHGAMSIQGEDDGDGELLGAVREVVGRDCPVFITHDLHANITARKTSLSDALLGYHTAPHVDHRQTGQRAARLLLRTLQTGRKPRNIYRKIPMLAPSVKMNTAIPPLAPIIRSAEEMELDPQTPAVSVFWMQPWLDVLEAGAAVNVVCYGPESAARRALDELAGRVWETRHELDLNLWRARDAIRDALAQPGRPCVFADTGDAPPGGAPGDSNHLLKAFVEENVGQAVMLPLADGPAVRSMHEAGEGAELSLPLGGSVDAVHFRPEIFTGRVTCLTDGTFTYKGPIARGQQAHIGLTAVFQIGSIHVLVHEKAAFSHDPSIYESAGLRWREAKIVVAKSPTQYRACYEEFASKIYEIETPGITTVNLRSLDFRRIPRPMYPFDSESEVEAAMLSGAPSSSRGQA